MRLKFISLTCATLMVLFFFAPFIFPNEGSAIQLPEPKTEGGMPLMQALKERKSSRKFSYQEIPLEVLSDLFWAAFGINRSDSGKRTAPSAKNMQEIDIYVAKADGLYLYDAKEHQLILVVAEDIRFLTGQQAIVRQAAVDLIFVADHEKMSGLTASEKNFYETIDTGYISQNVYLFCASTGLATVARASVRKSPLAKAMKLRPGQTIVLTQSVGYPAS